MPASHLTPVRTTDKNGRSTTVYRNLNARAAVGSTRLRASRPTFGGHRLDSAINALDAQVQARVLAPSFHAMLEERAALKARLTTIKGLLKEARAAKDGALARTYGRAHLADFEALVVLKKRIEEYKDATAPLVHQLEELRTERDMEQGSYKAYSGETLGHCRKVASFPSGSREWLEERQNGIGGSDMGPILRVGEYQYRQSNWERVFRSKVEPISDEQVAEQALNNSEFSGARGRGNAWEEAIFRRFAENHPELDVLHCKDSWQSTEVEYGHANLDGLICDPETGEPIEILEIKTSSEAEAWEDGVPPGYRAQALWYCRHFGVRRARFAVMIDDHEYREYTVEPFEGEMEHADREAAAFWELKKAGVMPARPAGKPHKGLPKDKAKLDQYLREAAAYRQESPAATRERFDELVRSSTFSDAIGALYTEHDPATRTMNTVSIDLETTTISPETGRIIEIGMTERDPGGKVVQTFEALLGVPDEILDIRGTGAEDVHKITREDVRGQLPFEHPAMQARIRELLEGRVLLAQNADFEYRWLTQNLDGFVEMDVPVVDTMKLAKMFVPDTVNNKLETIAGRFGVPYTNGHRALHDAEVTADVYMPLIEHIHRSGTAA